MKLRAQLKELLRSSESGLEAQDIAHATELIQHGEFQLAFELICDQLFEHDSKVSPELFRLMEALATIMAVPQERWTLPNGYVTAEKHTQMSDMAPYQQMRDRGCSSAEAFRQCLADRNGLILAVRVVREVFGLSIEEASRLRVLSTES